MPKSEARMPLACSRVPDTRLALLVVLPLETAGDGKLPHLQAGLHLLKACFELGALGQIVGFHGAFHQVVEFEADTFSFLAVQFPGPVEPGGVADEPVLRELGVLIDVFRSMARVRSSVRSRPKAWSSTVISRKYPKALPASYGSGPAGVSRCGSCGDGNQAMANIGFPLPLYFRRNAIVSSMVISEPEPRICSTIPLRLRKGSLSKKFRPMTHSSKPLLPGLTGLSFCAEPTCHLPNIPET